MVISLAMDTFSRFHCLLNRWRLTLLQPSAEGYLFCKWRTRSLNVLPQLVNIINLRSPFLLAALPSFMYIYFPLMYLSCPLCTHLLCTNIFPLCMCYVPYELIFYIHIFSPYICYLLYKPIYYVHIFSLMYTMSLMHPSFMYTYFPLMYLLCPLWTPSFMYTYFSLMYLSLPLCTHFLTYVILPRLFSRRTFMHVLLPTPNMCPVCPSPTWPCTCHNVIDPTVLGLWTKHLPDELE